MLHVIIDINFQWVCRNKKCSRILKFIKHKDLEQEKYILDMKRRYIEKMFSQDVKNMKMKKNSQKKLLLKNIQKKRAYIREHIKKS